MSDVEAKALRDRYLNLLRDCLVNRIYEDPPFKSSGYSKYDPEVREFGRDWPSAAHTMIGVRRLDNLRVLVESVLRENVPGDLIETGVWRGGACIYMRALLAAFGDADRRVWVADSFSGVPPPRSKTYPADKGSRLDKFSELAVPLDEVRRNFRKYGLLDERVLFLPGQFRDTLPAAPIKKLAVLRLDCDLYESTSLALSFLYDKLSVGGYVVVDDYAALDSCRKATDDFRRWKAVEEEIVDIDGTGVYWRKGKGRA